jgi:hypothetical protein
MQATRVRSLHRFAARIDVASAAFKLGRLGCTRATPHVPTALRISTCLLRSLRLFAAIRKKHAGPVCLFCRIGRKLIEISRSPHYEICTFEGPNCVSVMRLAVKCEPCAGAIRAYGWELKDSH